MIDTEIQSISTEHFMPHIDCIQIFTDEPKSEDGVGFAALFPNQIIK